MTQVIYSNLLMLLSIRLGSVANFVYPKSKNKSCCLNDLSDPIFDFA